MEYGKLINRAFQIAWRHKSLWFFGLFAGGGSSYFNLDLDGLIDNANGSGSLYGLDIPSFPEELLVPLILWFVLLGMVFFVMSLISEAGLIDSVNRIERGGVYRFGQAFSKGVGYFLRFLGMTILYIMLILLTIGVCGGLVALCFFLHVALGILSLLVAIPAVIVIIFWSGNMLCLTQRSIAVRDNSIGNGLEEAHILFKANLSKVFLITLIYIGLTILFGILGLIVWGIFGVPIAAAVYALGLGTIAAIIAGLFMGLPISLILGGYIGTFFSSLYTLFYFELLEPGRIMIHSAPPPDYPPQPIGPQ
ncbi:MAG: hypothetical protein KAU36_05750 [candidate division Zixibacteria bacterium]|nr:hypothetical protein [candidate division Zixibacteria bacterium]